MKRIALGVLVSVGVMGCDPAPTYAPLGSQLFIGSEALDTEPGAIHPMKFQVLNGDGNLALNNVIVEFTAINALLLPAEAIVGVSNQPTDTDGDGIPDTSPVSWCEAYVDDAEAYQDCFDDYFFDAFGADSAIGANYARLATDRRGFAEVYIMAFCDSSGGSVTCEGLDEDQEGILQANIGVDSVDVTLNFSAN